MNKTLTLILVVTALLMAAPQWTDTPNDKCPYPEQIQAWPGDIQAWPGI